MSAPQQQKEGHPLFLYLFPFVWNMLGGTIPVGWVRMPWAKKRVADAQISLQNLSNLQDFPDFKLSFASDFKVLSVQPVSTQSIVNRLADYGLDPFLHRLFFVEGKGRGGFKKVSLINTVSKSAVDLYVRTLPHNQKNFSDVAEGDDVSLLFSGGWPVFIYNQSAHVLMNCDNWDIRIGRNELTMPHKGKRIARRGVELVAAIIKEGNSLDLSRPSRLDFHQRSYDELPLVKSSFARELNEWLFIAFFGAFGVFLLYALLVAVTS